MKYAYVPTCWDTKFSFSFVYRDPLLKGHVRITGTFTVLRKWVKASWPWHCRFCRTVWSSLCSWGAHTRVYLRDNLLIVLFDESKAQTQRPPQHLRALKLPSTSTMPSHSNLESCTKLGHKGKLLLFHRWRQFCPHTPMEAFPLLEIQLYSLAWSLRLSKSLLRMSFKYQQNTDPFK